MNGDLESAQYYRLVYVITDVYVKADTHRNWSLGPNTDYVYVKADTQLGLVRSALQRIDRTHG